MNSQKSRLCILHFVLCKTDQIIQNSLIKNAHSSISCSIVPHHNPKALAEKMALLAKNFDLRKSFGLEGLERISSLFTIENQLTVWEEFYGTSL